MKVVLTGFGPFPGMPFNPSGPLAQRLARPSRNRTRDVSRTAHVFPTRYAALDAQLPRLLRRERPVVLVMFGVAERSHHLRIETLARNAINPRVADAGGHLPGSPVIAADAGASMPLRTAGRALTRAARAAGVDARLSDDAGSYLCNYLCWHATAAAGRPGGPKLAAFIHVPAIRGGSEGRLSFGQLLRAGEAIVQAAIAAARTLSVPPGTLR